MRIPWLMKKKTEEKTVHQRVAAELERQNDGRFTSKQPAEVMARTVEGENKLLSGTMTTFDSLLQFMDHFDKRIDDKVQARLGEGVVEEAGGGSEWLPIIAQLAPYIGPQLPALIEKFTGIPASPSGNSPSNSSLRSGEIMVPGAEQAGSASPSPQPSAPAGVNGVTLIKEAANNSPLAIKAALKLQGWKQLEVQGISKEEFKQAIANIHKAVNG